MEVENSQAAADTAAPAQESAAPEAPQTADIDGFSSFKFQGQELTPEALKKIFDERNNFESSLKETQKYRDYVDNLEIDLEKVVKDPSLAATFKQVYPKQFHAVLDRLLGEKRPDASANSTSPLPKDVQEKIDRMERKLQMFDQQTHKALVAEQEAYLQKTVDPLFDKYPYANTEAAKNAVFLKAQHMIDQGYQMTPSAWERLVKDTHLAIQGHAEKLRQHELKAQLNKGNEARDSGAGGSAPGQAPPSGPKNFSEAADAWLAELRRSS